MAKKKVQEDDGDSGFMVQFTALMLILLAFFILLNTMAVVDDSKARTAIGSLHHSFTSPYDGFLKEALESLRAIRSEANGDQVLIEDLVEELEGKARQQGLGMPGDIQAAKGGFYPRLTVANHVFYRNGGTEIAPRAFPILDRITRAAQDMNSRIIIESRTRGGEPDDPRHRSHWELSAERSANLQRYFVDAAGMPMERIEAEGVANTRGRPDRARDIVIITLRPMRPGKPKVENEAPMPPPVPLEPSKEGEGEGAEGTPADGEPVEGEAAEGKLAEGEAVEEGSEAGEPAEGEGAAPTEAAAEQEGEAP